MPVRPNALNSDIAAADYSSASTNHVLVNSRSRHGRQESSDGWLDDSKADTSDSPNSTGTLDEVNQRPSSAASSSTSKLGDQVKNVDGRGRQALLQLREEEQSSNPITSSSSSSTNRIQGSTSLGDTVIQDKKLFPAANSVATNTGTCRSHPRVEGNSVIPDEEVNDEEEMVDDIEDEELSAPPSPQNPQDMRIMFHGREIFAEDLIGLRVAKTFAGYGRFIGQVVKFDKKVALYTVVYADGDAEDVTVDGTLQILIENEIERADPEQLPPAISLLLKKGDDGASPASPDAGDFMVSPLPGPRQLKSFQRRVQLQVSEREAQFVIGLFENHALPTLMRKGWRVQTSNAGETRYVSPTGELFSSALDVVGHIASDHGLLTSCFPSNVHAAILSLLPHEAPASSTTFTETASNYGGASCKRTTLESPNTEPLSGKRIRHVHGEGYSEITDSVSRGPARAGEVMQYKAEDRRSEASNWISAYRGQEISGRIHVANDRFSGEMTDEPCIRAPHDLRAYRRTPHYDPTMTTTFASKWSRTEPVFARTSSAEYMRRFVDTPGWHERGDTFANDRYFDVHPRYRSHPDGRSIHQLYGRNSAHAEHSSTLPTSDIPRSYSRGSSSSSGSGTCSTTDGLPYSHYSTLRSRPNDYSQTSVAPRLPRETASFMSPTDPLGTSATFSMIDVDRVSTPRSRSFHFEKLRGRSPRQSGPHSFLPHQAHQNSRRTNGSHGFHSRRDSDNHYVLETASEHLKEQFGLGKPTCSTIHSSKQ
ncbi:hypothetical protein PsorP6_004568 [Peronosclerospora sorghi]|uniref:Uncharacterized protein n=1 Tax=Peronosclerospora sorghi TaxID=230839 RepID=A0ACC0VKE4_9STRA|nr:hypothetical protein PsorP6_004568 [Peronosclerospora sorghi]